MDDPTTSQGREETAEESESPDENICPECGRACMVGSPLCGGCDYEFGDCTPENAAEMHDRYIAASYRNWASGCLFVLLLIAGVVWASVLSFNGHHIPAGNIWAYLIAVVLVTSLVYVLFDWWLDQP